MTKNPTPDETWHDAAECAQLDPDFPTGVEIEGRKIGLFLQGDAVHAVEDVCPHAYALLSQGFLEEGVIECPLHAARFEVATGKCLTEIGQRDLQCFAVRIHEGRVQVQLPAVSTP